MISTSMLEHILGRLAEDKYINEKWSDDINDFTYEITNKGQQKIINVIKTDKEARIKYFLILMNLLSKMENIPTSQAFIETIRFFKKDLKIDIKEDFDSLNMKGVISQDDFIILKDMYDSI